MTINQIQKRNPEINHTKLMQCDDNIPKHKNRKKAKKNLLLVVFFNFRQQTKPT